MATVFSLFAMLQEDQLRNHFQASLSAGKNEKSAISDIMIVLGGLSMALGVDFEERRAAVQRTLEEKRFQLIDGLMQGYKFRWQLRTGEGGFAQAVPELVFPGAKDEGDIKFLLSAGVTPNPMDSNIVALLTAVGFDFNSLPEWLRELPRKEPTEEDITSYREQLQA